MTELRAQRREPCEHAPFGCVSQDDPHHCDGCNGDGTRWVTVGRLVADENTDFSYTIEAEA